MTGIYCVVKKFNDTHCQLVNECDRRTDGLTDIKNCCSTYGVCTQCFARKTRSLQSLISWLKCGCVPLVNFVKKIFRHARHKLSVLRMLCTGKTTRNYQICHPFAIIFCCHRKSCRTFAKE